MAERGPIRGTSLYLVLKSNGLRHSKNPPVKFSFSLKIVPATIAKKLSPQRCFKPLLIPIFNFPHKRPTFAFTSESGYTLGPAQRIAHNGTHGETGTFPPPATARLCASSEIFYSATLLYTYISRFSVNPHHRQTEKIRQSCRLKLYLKPLLIPFFNFSHKWPTFAFTPESGYTLGLRRKIAHKGTHGETGGVLGGGGITTLGAFHTVRKPCVAGCQNGVLCRFWGLVVGAPKERREPSGQRCAYARRCSEGVAAPLGCVICLQLGDVAVFSLCAQGLSVCARRGVVSLPSARFTCC